MKVFGNSRKVNAAKIADALSHTLISFVKKLHEDPMFRNNNPRVPYGKKNFWILEFEVFHQGFENGALLHFINHHHHHHHRQRFKWVRALKNKTFFSFPTKNRIMYASQKNEIFPNIFCFEMFFVGFSIFDGVFRKIWLIIKIWNKN